MDFSNRLNRPAQQPASPQSDAPQSPMHSKHDGGGKQRGKFLNFSRVSELFILICGALIAAALVLILVFGGAEEAVSREKDLINTDKYQAVFLNSQDGQVYFGKLSVYNEDLYALKDIYYVRVETPIQPQGANAQNQSKISLAKLGNELHGPEDYMFIARDKVLYWENLKDDGQVVKAITDFQKNGSSDEDTTNTNQPAETDKQNP